MAWAWLLAIFVLMVVVLLWRKPAAPEPSPEVEEGSDGDAIGVIAIEDAIDLHGFQPKEIPDVVESYLEAAAERGLREVRLIHGRGKGVQRRRVQALLRRHPRVESFHDAPAHRGGWGATIVYLKASS